MRVVETVSGTNAPNSNTSSNAPPQLQSIQSSQPASTLTPPPLVSTQTVNIQQTVPLLQVATLRPDATIQLTVNTQSSPQLQANTLSVQQQHAHQQVIQVYFHFHHFLCSLVFVLLICAVLFQGK